MSVWPYCSVELSEVVWYLDHPISRLQYLPPVPLTLEIFLFLFILFMPFCRRLLFQGLLQHVLLEVFVLRLVLLFVFSLILGRLLLAIDETSGPLENFLPPALQVPDGEFPEFAEELIHKCDYKSCPLALLPL
jgi:hypothetical protein